MKRIYLAKSQANERQEKAEREIRVHQSIDAVVNFLSETGNRFQKIGEAYMDY